LEEVQMSKRQKLVCIFFGGPLLGLLGVLGYWIYQLISDPDNAPAFTDLPGVYWSFFQRGWLIVNGSIQAVSGSSADPVALAAGLIAQFEGFSPKAYPDPAGQTATYSIGYGHQIVSGDGYSSSSTISESDAIALLDSDLGNYVQCVNNAVTVTLSPQQLAALYSLCYNIGCSAFTGSTLLQDVNGGADADTITADFAMWNKANGSVLGTLVNRRSEEAALYNSSATPAAASTDGTQDASTDDSSDTSDADQGGD
jgi:GH24 family phage-related lysozyme (muramidase)